MKMCFKIKRALLLVLLPSFLLLPSNSEKLDNGKGNWENLVRGNNEFCIDLYQQLSREKGNILFSPYSISTALAMPYAGARGITKIEMARVLDFSLSLDHMYPALLKLTTHIQNLQTSDSIILNTANSMWMQNGFLIQKQFTLMMNDFFKTEPFPVDYTTALAREKTRMKINLWVENKTNRKILNLIPRGILTPLTRLILTNAIYFKANWATQFNSSQTEKRYFWITSDQKILVPMMSMTATFNYFENNSIQVLEMPYAGKSLSMLILLPRKKSGIGKLEQVLEMKPIKDWISGLHPEKVAVSFPRFKMNDEVKMKETLMSMGMKAAFSPRADFSGITIKPEDKLLIDEVIHQAFIEVNEKGSQAAASTAVIMRKKGSGLLKAIDFRADHPFVFIIRDNTSGNIIFMGRVVNPAL